MSGGFSFEGNANLWQVNMSALGDCPQQNKDIDDLASQHEGNRLMIQDAEANGDSKEDIRRLQQENRALMKHLQILRASVAGHLLEDLVPKLTGLTKVFKGVENSSLLICDCIENGDAPIGMVRDLAESAQKASEWTKQIAGSVQKNLRHLKELSSCLDLPEEPVTESVVEDPDPIVVIDMSEGASAAIPAGSGGCKRGELSSDFSNDEWFAFLDNPRQSMAKAGSSRGEGGPGEEMEVDVEETLRQRRLEAKRARSARPRRGEGGADQGGRHVHFDDANLAQVRFIEKDDHAEEAEEPKKDAKRRKRGSR
jgi:hypothetical protein